MNRQEVFNYKDYLTNFINNKYEFFTFIFNDDKVDNHELKQRKEDFISDILLKAYDKFELFNKDKSKLGSWLCNLAKHNYIDLQRHEKVKLKHVQHMIYTKQIE